MKGSPDHLVGGKVKIQTGFNQSVEQKMALQGSDESTSSSGESWAFFNLQKLAENLWVHSGSRSDLVKCMH